MENLECQGIQEGVSLEKFRKREEFMDQEFCKLMLEEVMEVMGKTLVTVLMEFLGKMRYKNQFYKENPYI
jgi:hypothetical protein